MYIPYKKVMIFTVCKQQFLVVSSHSHSKNVHLTEILTLYDTENKSLVLLSGEDEECFVMTVQIWDVVC